jgi:hypothetical protein
MLEAARQERQHAARLAVKSAPEADDLVAARRCLHESHRGFHRLGAARVQLRPIEIARRKARKQPDECRAMLGREAAHVHALELSRHLRHIPGVRVPQARDADAGQQIHVAIAVHLVGTSLDGEAQRDRAHALGGVAQGLELGCVEDPSPGEEAVLPKRAPLRIAESEARGHQPSLARAASISRRRAS